MRCSRRRRRPCRTRPRPRCAAWHLDISRQDVLGRAQLTDDRHRPGRGRRPGPAMRPGRHRQHRERLVVSLGHGRPQAMRAARDHRERLAVARLDVEYPRHVPAAVRLTDDGHRPGGQRGSHPQPGARGDHGPGGPASRPGQAGLSERLGEAVADGDWVHGQQVVGRRESRGEADLWHRGPAGRARRSRPATVSRERGTATRCSGNCGPYSGA